MMRYKLKTWILDDDGGVIMGEGRIRLLMAIAEHGSINKASESLGMSYRAAWRKLKDTEQRLGVTLVATQSGGHYGGGSSLTPEGARLLEEFRLFHKRVAEAADEAFANFAERRTPH